MLPLTNHDFLINSHYLQNMMNVKKNSLLNCFGSCDLHNLK